MTLHGRQIGNWPSCGRIIAGCLLVLTGASWTRATPFVRPIAVPEAKAPVQEDQERQRARRHEDARRRLEELAENERRLSTASRELAEQLKRVRQERRELEMMIRGDRRRGPEGRPQGPDRDRGPRPPARRAGSMPPRPPVDEDFDRPGPRPGGDDDREVDALNRRMDAMERKLDMLLDERKKSKGEEKADSHEETQEKRHDREDDSDA